MKTPLTALGENGSTRKSGGRLEFPRRQPTAFPKRQSRKLRACHHFSRVESFYHGLLSQESRGICVAAAISLWGSAAAADNVTPKIVAAANKFLSTLDQKQRQNVLFAFDDAKQRTRWSNLPNTMVPRAGLAMGELNAAQRDAAMALVASMLSPRGFEKVEQIVEGDEILNKNEPGRKMFGRDLFYSSILGKPSEKDPWMLQFGGHHLALNVTIAGEHGVLTPTLTGAQPALYTKGGKTIRPLGGESDKAIALLKSLDDGQRKQAILSS